jgi:hypothetical protein
MTEKKPSQWWEVTCEGDDLKKAREDPRFPYIVTLARATNALNLATAILPHIEDFSSPVGARDSLNSFLFTCSILYEALRLTRKMNPAFVHDDSFQKGLGTLLNDHRAKRLGNSHWAAVRNRAVFHFDPTWFAKQLNNSIFDKCIFLRAEGKEKKTIYYSFSDEVAFELMLGIAVDSEGFMTRFLALAKDTTDLAIEFSNHAENLIAHTLHDWGFTLSEIPASIKSSSE